MGVNSAWPKGLNCFTVPSATVGLPRSGLVGVRGTAGSLFVYVDM